MVRPSDASTVAGMFRENVVRSQETPGRVSAGTLAERPAVVERPADRVAERLAAERALDAPGHLRGRTRERDRGEAEGLLERVVGAAVLLMGHGPDQDGEHMASAALGGGRDGKRYCRGPALHGRLAGRRCGYLAGTEERAIQPGQEHADLAGLVPDVDRRGTGRAGVLSPVPDVAVVEAVVVHKEHRLAGWHRGGAV